jgi:hypothetical protein
MQAKRALGIALSVAFVLTGLALSTMGAPSAIAAPDCTRPNPPPICERTTTTRKRTTTTQASDRTDNFTVWRLQVRVVVGDVGDAGTDDDVMVQLNGANRTQLDSPANDFERNSSRLYDLPLTGVGRMKDISSLTIQKVGADFKTGDDGVCVARVDLLVNGVLAFDGFPSPSGPCLWLDSDPGELTFFNFSGTTLRTDNAWLAYQQPGPPLVIPADEWRGRIEGIVGNSIASNALYWGDISGEAVELSGDGGPVLHVDLDLAADAPLLPDPGVDIDFDLVFSCATQPDGKIQLEITSTNVHAEADSSIFWELITFDLIDFLDSHVTDSVKTGFKPISQSITTPICPNVHVQADGTTFLF